MRSVWFTLAHIMVNLRGNIRLFGNEGVSGPPYNSTTRCDQSPTQ